MHLAYTFCFPSLFVKHLNKMFQNKSFESLSAICPVCWSFWLCFLFNEVSFLYFLLIFLVTSAPPEILEGKSCILSLFVNSVDPSCCMRIAFDILVYYHETVCPVSVRDWNLSPSVKLASLTVETDRIQIQKEKVWQPLILRSYACT